MASIDLHSLDSNAKILHHFPSALDSFFPCLGFKDKMIMKCLWEV